jgi:hypothetical protein
VSLLYILYQSLGSVIGHKRVSKRSHHDSMVDQETFVQCTSHHATINKQWKHDIETRRDLARNYLITGGDEAAQSDDRIGTEAVTVIETAIHRQKQTNTIPFVTATRMVALATQLDVVNEFTLNDQQKSAFMIVTGHLNSDSRYSIGLSHDSFKRHF